MFAIFALTMTVFTLAKQLTLVEEELMVIDLVSKLQDTKNLHCHTIYIMITLSTFLKNYLTIVWVSLKQLVQRTLIEQKITILNI